MSFHIGQSQTGFSAVELIIVVTVAGVLGIAGFTVYNKQQDEKKAAGTSQAGNQQARSTDDEPEAPEINSTGDLDKASAALDKTDTDSDSDSSQLDSELNTF